MKLKTSITIISGCLFIFLFIMLPIFLSKQDKKEEYVASFKGSNFTLKDMNNKTITQKSFEGPFTAIFFGFTHCPDICPMTLNKMDIVLDKLKEENEAYKGKSCGPGGIQFIYGDGPRDCITYQSFFPEEGDMFIFPAWLKHWVAPYRSDCTRISVSGNVHDSAPLNAIKSFAPEYLKDKKK